MNDSESNKQLPTIGTQCSMRKLILDSVTIQTLESQRRLFPVQPPTHDSRIQYSDVRPRKTLPESAYLVLGEEPTNPPLSTISTGMLSRVGFWQFEYSQGVTMFISIEHKTQVKQSLCCTVYVIVHDLAYKAVETDYFIF